VHFLLPLVVVVLFVILATSLLHDITLCRFQLKIKTRTTEQGNAFPKNVFMVFEYLEYDLTGVLETPEIRLSQDHIKSWSQQLLSGVHYMHTNKVIHRDLKASNLLINRKGELKIADWGLARSWNSEMKRLTNKVITLWYRPPELLLGCIEYTPKIDMWSVGCIIAEMFRRSAFLKGRNEAHQLELIFKVCGTPDKANWPELEEQCRLWRNFRPGPTDQVYPNRLAESLRANLPHPKWMTDEAVSFIGKLMEENPNKRWSAEQALDADYFFENPIVKQAKDLNMKFAVQSVHEMGKCDLNAGCASKVSKAHLLIQPVFFHFLRLPQEI
jgi:cyclin-dependent kinase 12/13